LALEKRAPKVLLQHAYLLADGCRRYRELVGSAHVTTKPRCRFERPQRIEMDQARGHKENLSVVERTIHFSTAFSAITVTTCYPRIRWRIA
jgi:hypothetical protein